MTDFHILLFDGFETLDAFGPAEIIGLLPDAFALRFYSPSGGIVTSSQQVRVDTAPAAELRPGGVLLIPGGFGTRALIQDEGFIHWLAQAANQAHYVLTVCTGSALLAKAGFLDGRSATSNKGVFDWVRSVNTRVNWLERARWVVDGNCYTSSGISAGMDMCLRFVSDWCGERTAERVARNMEYVWNKDWDCDPFAVSAGGAQ